jgi:hypothetical protein
MLTMIILLLQKLFGQNGYETRYSAKPSHIFLPLLIMSSGYRILLIEKWDGLGWSMFILGILLGITIIVCLNWEKVIEYWNTINEHVRLMERVKNPELWQALGYKQIPQTIKVIEKEDKGGGSFTWRMKEYKITPTQMNSIANKVLNNRTLEFTEEMYGSLIPNFRKFRKNWIDEGKLVQKNKKNKRLGYVLSKKGLQVMYEFASDYVKMEIEKQ